MRTIAVIKKNKCSFGKMEELAMPLLYKQHIPEEKSRLMKNINDYIWSVIEPYVTFINIGTDDDFMTVICQNLITSFPDKNPGDFFYHTEGSYSSPKKFIELVYCQPMWKDYSGAQPANMNHYGCLFSLKHHVIENDCIIIANRYDLNAPYFTMIDSVTKDDLLRIVRRRFFFTAVLIGSDSMTKYYYQNPSYLVSTIFGMNMTDKIEKLPFSHLKYNLIYYFKQNKTNYVNQIATRINGSYRVHGDVLVLHEMEENIYTNLSVHEMKRLNVLSYGRLYDRQLKPEENYSITKIEIDDDGKENKKYHTLLE